MLTKRRTFVIFLIILILISLILTIRVIHNQNTEEFYFGVEFAYSYPENTTSTVIVNDAKNLIDRVKNFTNIFVIGSIPLTQNQTALNETCDYIVKAGLNFIILFTGRNSYNAENQPFPWIVQAKQKYGEKFLAVYRYDEPGGNQLDQGPSRLIENKTTYSQVAQEYTSYLEAHIQPYTNVTSQLGNTTVKIITADYGLYWFDYSAGYDVILTEFGANNTRTIDIALCRGAASTHNKEWGAIITSKYNNPPYIESPSELYDDMALAYCCGAKYCIVFNYPKINEYGILTEDHLKTMEEFWNTIHTSGPTNLNIQTPKIAYVLPPDYGFGFRRETDTIWGLWQTDDKAQKIWSDVNYLAEIYGCGGYDIVYNQPEFYQKIKNDYENLLIWNQTIR